MDPQSSSNGATPPGTRAGFAAIVGRPNVGKSTLLNRVLGDKLVIVSPRPQTTRNRILGIRTFEGRDQLMLLDTPGIHRRKGQLHLRIRQVKGVLSDRNHVRPNSRSMSVSLSSTYVGRP